MNLDWVVDQRDLTKALGIARIAVINDLEASAFGIGCLSAADVHTVNPGVPDPAGHAVVVSPGTGLGEAGLYWDGQRHHPIATEGGHTDFAPRNQREWELLQYLRAKYRYDHISYERVVSGPGLVDLYEFLRDSGRGADDAWTPEEQQQDPGAVISNRAAAGRSAVCAQALEMFFEICGAEAGNFALKMMATGGVWLGGGILVKNLSRLRSSPAFMAGFIDKGRLRPLLERMPVKLILNDRVALLGAANYALGR
jgi:glucokinase